MNLRDAYHIIVGFTIMYLIGYLTEFSEYTLDSKLIGVPIASAFIGAMIGFFWEWYNSVKNQSFFDFKDIYRTSIGSFLGGILSLFIISQTIIIISGILSILLVLNDVRHYFKK